MDLPVGMLATLVQKQVKLFGRLVRRGVGADVPGMQTIADRQQIHTQAVSRDAHTLRLV